MTNINENFVKHNFFRVVGYMPTDSVPKEDYKDFMGASFSSEEVEVMLKDGVLPPGLILNRGERTPSLQVWGAYDTRQKLAPVMVRIKMK